ncbi:hypothetical protein ABZ816_42405 [Actinosynnema sp. NPDC047251]|uniref:Uncharacterized protein n=1 Tax=Saccharothrix espanaensis (strain ATCC 51144 / DSM 44229 / JCM 9112 / NBRC 15066 / NRRL 15764) TaxID=1179773 RepID=K0K4W2_SACES|nr:hypothetical protein BN6_53440 [Saccharothrix espanaensis DSM 44229]
MNLLARYADVDGKVRFFADDRRVPLDGVADERAGSSASPTSLCVVVSDPEDDLPGDFDTAREVHHAALHKPVDVTAFVADLEQRSTRTRCATDCCLCQFAIATLSTPRSPRAGWRTSTPAA